jgi:hypothetical protein
MLSSIGSKPVLRISRSSSYRCENRALAALAAILHSMASWPYGPNGFSNPNVVPTLWGFKPQSNGSVNWTSQSSTLNTQSAKLSSNIQGGLTATSPTGHYNLGGSFGGWGSNWALGEMFSYNSANQSW